MTTQRNNRNWISWTQKISAFCILVTTMIQFTTCTPDLSDDPIPYLPFSPITINLSQKLALHTNGGYIPISSSEGGVQGIILYRLNASTYIAYERNCSYQPNGACVTVDVDTSGLYMYDPCCSSTFAFATGQPTGGPAWRPLRKYETLLTGTQLTITDTIVE